MGRIFIRRFPNAKITELNGRTYFEEEIKTLRVDKKGDRFIVYELGRKGKKPRRIKTFNKNKKFKKIADVEHYVQTDNEFQYNLIYKDNISDSNKKIIQTNYLSKSRKTPQILAVMRVEDSKRGIVDYFTCYSRKTGIGVSMGNARADLIDMAYAKFCSKYGNVKKTDDVVISMVEERYIYYAKH